MEEKLLQEVSEDPHAGGPGFLKAGGVPASVYTLSATSLGVGAFVLPSIFDKIGILPGIGCLGFFALWSYFFMVQLIKMGQALNVSSYEALVEQVLGKFGSFLLAFFIAISVLLANSSHIAVVAGLLHDLIEYYISDSYGTFPYDSKKELILYLCVLSVALIFCTGNKINELRYVSTASVCVVLVTCIWCTGECFFWYWPKGQYQFTGSYASPLASSDWKMYAANIPTFAFVYSGTFCLFPVYNELRDQSIKNVRKAIAYSNALCCFGYLIVSIVGVLTFGSEINTDSFQTNRKATNYLYVFPPSHFGVTILCFFLVVVITLLYGVLNFPMVKSVEKMIILISPGCGARFLEWKYHSTVITVIGMVLIVNINLAAKELSVLFAMSGGFGCTFVVYFIPSLLLLRNKGGRPHSLWKKVFLWVSLCAVLAIAVLFTYSLFSPDTGSTSSGTNGTAVDNSTGY